jgi:hypothetical protein
MALVCGFVVFVWLCLRGPQGFQAIIWHAFLGYVFPFGRIFCLVFGRVLGPRWGASLGLDGLVSGVWLVSLAWDVHSPGHLAGPIAGARAAWALNVR